MKKSILKFLPLLLFTVSVAFSAPVDELTKLLGAYSTYSASFNQKAIAPRSTKQVALQFSGDPDMQSTHGKVYIKRPGKFRWEATDPTQDITILNGKVMWHYDVDLMEATKQTLAASMNQQNPAVLLTNKVDNLMREYNVTAVKLNQLTWYLLEPKQKSANFKKVYLHFDQGKLSGLIVINNLAQQVVYDFSNVKINQVIPDSLFNFTAPKGVTVSNQNESS